MHTRMLAAATLVAAALSPHVYAQPDLVPKDGKVTIPVRLTPSDYLKPVSRAYLLPEYAEAIPGNQVQMFLRCFMERANVFGQAASDLREKWDKMILQDLPANKLREYESGLRRDMYDAARMTQADWQLWYFLRRDGYETLLPDAQKMRQLAAALKPRIRGEIASGEYEAAIHSLKALLGLARTFDSHPTLIGCLIGQAIAHQACDAIEEIIQQPGAPNLYWALMDLPTPFVSLRHGMGGERLMISNDIETLKTAADAVEDSIILKQIDKVAMALKVELSEGKKPAAETPLGYAAHVQAREVNAIEVKAARQRLVEMGLNAESVRKWSSLHVVFLDDIIQYEHYRDEVGKLMSLPYWQIRADLAEKIAEIKTAMAKCPVLALVPATEKVKQSQTRADQRIAYLQILEAIRLHAFHHGGSLPAKLADIKLPLPIDPVSGKPFEYSVQKGVATLHGENPNAPTEATNRYYEITIVKK